jgi:signal transduction histidine kinase
MGSTVARVRAFVVVRSGESISYLRRRPARRRPTTLGVVQRFALALVLAAAGLVEVLLLDDGGAVSAVAVVVATVPLAWRRRMPLVPLTAIALALIADSALDGVLVGNTATPLVALVIALYSVGRYAGELGLVGGALGVVVVTATRVVADPAVDSVGHAVLTLVAVSIPLLAGQTLLQRRFVQRAERLERDRDRDARAAAEEERMRIAGDLRAAIAGRLHEIVDAADPERIDRATLATIATDARDALADVRRVLGILRRDGQAAPLTPAADGAVATVAGDPVVATGDDVANPAEDGAVATAEGAPPGAAGDGGAKRAALTDRALAAAVLLGAGVELAVVAGAPAVLTGVLVAAPLLFRRRWPLPAAAAVFAGVAIQSATLDLDSFPISDIAAVVVATYSIAAFSDRRAALAGLTGALAFAAGHAAIAYPDGVVAALLGGVAAPWIGGRVVRNHRQLTEQGREEAEAAERARVAEKRAAVIAERMRVARELHDAVAHNISVIAIQAGGADGILDKDPARTRAIVALIRTVAREAETELHRLVGTPDTAPPSLANVDALASRAREAGQTVELTIQGDPAPLPRGLDLAAYRIVQEALANAAKHAAGAPARVLVKYDARALEVEVKDDGGAGVGSGNGHGLVGIEERVALYGGTLQIGARPRGGFQVKARLPIA